MSSPANANKPVSVTLWADRINQAYNGELGDEAGRKARDRINWMCAQAQGDSVLDIGCSQGIATLLLAREGFNTVGIDISEDAIAYARAEQEKELPSVRDRIEFLCTDLAALAAGREFDTVIMGEVLEHQAHTAKFLKAAASHVKAGGTLVVTVPFGLHPFPDHKATIFPRDILTILGDQFSVTSFDVHDGYIRFTGVKDCGASAASADLAARMTEIGSFYVQQKYFELHAKNATVTKKSAEFKKALDERTRELGTLTSRCNVLEREQDSLQEKISHLQTTLQAADDARVSVEQEHAERMQRLQHDLAALSNQRSELESKLAAVQQAQYVQQNERITELAALQSELGQAKIQRGELEAALAAARHWKTNFEKESADRVASLQADLAQATNHRAELEAALAAARRMQAALETDHAERVARLQTELEEAAGRRAGLETALTTAQQAQAALENDHAARVAELALIAGQRDEFEAALATARQSQATLENDGAARTASLQAELDQAVSQRDALQSALTVARQAQTELERDNAARLADLQTELQQSIAKRMELETALAAARVSNADRENEDVARAAALTADLDAATRTCGELKSQLMQVRAAEVAAQNLRTTEVGRLQAALTALEHKTAQARAAEAQAQAARIAALERRIERNAELMARRQAALEMSAMAVRKTLSFQLGSLLINGFKSPRNLVKLPGALLALRSEAKSRRTVRRNKDEAMPALSMKTTKHDAPGLEIEDLLSRFNSGGVSAVSAFLLELNTKPHAQATAFTQLARHLQTIFPDRAAEAARQAYVLDPQPYRAKWLAFRLFEAGALVEPAELLAALPDTESLSVSERRRAEEVAALVRLRTTLPELESGVIPPYVPVRGSLLYVAASALPYHTTGYTVRTHELVKAMMAAGIDVTVLTRPGYPWDRPDRKGEPQNDATTVDQVRYVHRSSPAQGLPLDVYFDDAARAIADVAKRQKVAAIHAASNHVNALPALLAARSLGIPFVYEMRGLWELSRASKVPNYETTERFQIGFELEAFVAKNADRVYVISNALAKFIADWGVNPAKVAVLPNCINDGTIRAAEETQTIKITDAFTIGYAGAMVGYEGLDVLIDALAHLKARGQRVNVRLIGDGDMRTALEALTAERGLSDQVSFLGKLAPDRARAELAATHAVAIPRKPHHVCEIIPPLKLVEAMALGMPVIVPDLPVFCEEVKHEETGLLFKAGDPVALAGAIERLMNDSGLTAQLGTNARSYVAKARVWDRFAAQIKTQMESSRVADIYREGGHEAVLQTMIKEYGGRKKSTATALLRAAKSLFEQGYEDADYPLAQAALGMDRSEGTLRAAFWAIQRTKDFTQARAIIAELEQAYAKDPTPKSYEQLVKLKASPSYMLSVLDEVRAPAAPRFDSIANRVCYVLHNTLPYSSGGYATRSHGVASGLHEAGWDVVVLSRPGFPLDIKPDLAEADVSPVDMIDHIPYVRTLAPKRKGTSGRQYVMASADAIEARLREYRPSVVVAASNHLTALPALIAARRLGLPFVYEVRGLWEVTRISRDPEFGDSAEFEVIKTLEAGTGQLADHVFTLTEPMREELAERGIAYKNIDLLPNSCDPTRFNPVPRNEELARRLGIPSNVPVIGYVGTFVDYEGLENLTEACALLKKRGIKFRLLMVGNENTSDQSRGPITEQIIQVAEQNDFSDWLILTGRVPHEEVEAYYSLVDIAPFPRKPLPVCEMVSPMKPLEALAMEKAVVVSSVRALVEMVQDGKTGLVFEKGNVESLATTLYRLIESPSLRATLGANGRDWVKRERTWAQIGTKAGTILTRLVESSAVIGTA